MSEFPADMINATSDMLKSIIDQLTAENADLRAKLEKAQRSECSVRRELVSHREKAQGNYWAWSDWNGEEVEVCGDAGQQALCETEAK